MSEENFKEIINKRFNEKMEIEYALEFNFDEIVKKVINVKHKDEELKILQKIIEKQQKEIEELRDTNKKLYEMGKQRAIQEILNENWVSKDKIRKKIKELKKMKLTKGDIFFKMRNYAILILRELLEE